jgi:hypothetical protein
VLSIALMVALAAEGHPLAAQALPPLEIPRREAIQLFAVVRDTRLDFT